MSSAVQIDDLSFSYSSYEAPVIQHLNLNIKTGSRFGIFGPNGAGKTTLLSLITGLTGYQSGSIKLFGKEINQHKKFIKHTIGLVPQDFSFYEELSPVENMEFFGACYGLDQKMIHTKTQELLSIMGLVHVMKKPVKYFSGGMKRRVNLAIGVMNEPKILFLDEPTVGVDVQSGNAIMEYLKQINSEKGITLVYTSHQLKEAEALCEYVALIDKGTIIASDSLPDLLLQHQQEGLEGLFLNLTGHAYRD